MRFLTQIFIVMTNINQTNFLLSLFFYEESIIVLIKNLTIMKKLSFAELKGRVSWGSVLGGVMTVLAISVLLSILNSSIGLFMLNPLSEHPASGILQPVRQILWASAPEILLQESRLQAETSIISLLLMKLRHFF